MNWEKDAHPHLKKDLVGFSKLAGRFRVRIEGRFDSAHYLYAYLPDGGDEPVHGHSWLVQVTLAGPDESTRESGIAFDFMAVHKRLNELLERIGHLCINDLDEFRGVNPTAENIARWFYQGLRTRAAEQKGRILEVRVHEGPGNVAIFFP